MLHGDLISGGDKNYIVITNTPHGDYVSNDGICTHFGNLHNWKKGSHISESNRDNGPTTYRFSVMGVPVGEVTCDSSVWDHANAIFGGAHVDIASRTSLARNWATDIYRKCNSGDGVVTDQLLRDSAYDLEHGTMPMFDNGDHISGKIKMTGHGDAPIITDEAKTSPDYDEEGSDIYSSTNIKYQEVIQCHLRR
jgi:hypothetical protein